MGLAKIVSSIIVSCFIAKTINASEGEWSSSAGIASVCSNYIFVQRHTGTGMTRSIQGANSAEDCVKLGTKIPEHDLKTYILLSDLKERAKHSSATITFSSPVNANAYPEILRAVEHYDLSADVDRKHDSRVFGPDYEEFEIVVTGDRTNVLGFSKALDDSIKNYNKSLALDVVESEEK